MPERILRASGSIDMENFRQQSGHVKEVLAGTANGKIQV
tara:strand:- start:1085 stop:1201 length:117 start_codon:yes stop_codon:yes gene_type:complete